MKEVLEMDEEDTIDSWFSVTNVKGLDIYLDILPSLREHGVTIVKWTLTLMKNA